MDEMTVKMLSIDLGDDGDKGDHIDGWYDVDFGDDYNKDIARWENKAAVGLRDSLAHRILRHLFQEESQL